MVWGVGYGWELGGSGVKVRVCREWGFQVLVRVRCRWEWWLRVWVKVRCRWEWGLRSGVWLGVRREWVFGSLQQRQNRRGSVVGWVV